MIEKIECEDYLLALTVCHHYNRPAISFFTPDGCCSLPKGKEKAQAHRCLLFALL
jgi:hypothetical protein